MLQSPKYHSSLTTKDSDKSRVIGRFMAGMRYRLRGLLSPARKRMSPGILHGIRAHGDDFRHISFTFAIVAISARVACADGTLTREKYLAFRESFPLKSSICGKIRALFTLACADQTPLEHYLTQITYSYPNRPELYASMVDHLFRIACADGAVSREAERVLAAIAHGLHVPAARYNHILSRYVQVSQAHRVLGLNVDAKPQLVKKRYRELMRSYHPDRFTSDALSPELKSLLKLKASEINEAYRSLSSRSAKKAA